MICKYSIICVFLIFFFICISNFVLNNEVETDTYRFEQLSNSKVIYPLASDDFTITQVFNQSSNVSSVYSTHTGNDYALNKKGVAVVSMSEGTVVKIVNTCSKYGGYINNSCGGYFGNHIVIKYGDYNIIYAHLADIKVKENQQVKLFDTIATMGNSGNTSGMHLHFELRRNSRAIDPNILLSELNLKIINNKEQYICFLENNNTCSTEQFSELNTNFKNEWINSKIKLIGG